MIENKIQHNIPLAPLTTFKIGGLAKFFIELDKAEELPEIIGWAKDNGHKYFILGGGSNVLFSDQGFNGIVIRMQFCRFEFKGNILFAECGCGMKKLINESMDRLLGGIECLNGIPGTLGGAIRGNAHSYGTSMSDVVLSVKYFDIDKNSIFSVANRECSFAYHQSIFKEYPGKLILSAELQLKPSTAESLAKKSKECMEKRLAKGSYDFPSAGSVFNNPFVDDPKLLERAKKDIGIAGNQVPAGWLIQEAGLKGKKIGFAMVSEKNANFIYNTGSAKATDVIILMSLIKEKVRNQFGIQLKEEIIFVDY